MKFLISAAFLLVLSSAAFAQDEERIKRIVERIEREIRDSHDRTREEIRAIIRAEIQKSGKPAPPPVEAPPAPARGRPFLGITAEDMTDEERKAHPTGIKIAEVRGPAKEAGLQSGDLLLEVDGRAVTETNLGEILSKRKPGDELELTVLSGKKSRHVKLVLGERKE